MKTSRILGIFLKEHSHFIKQDAMTHLDQAGAHRAKRLQIPANIILIFQPWHSPEKKPIERVWQHLKLGLRWKLPKNLDELRLLMRARLEEMTQPVIASIVG